MHEAFDGTRSHPARTWSHTAPTSRSFAWSLLNFCFARACRHYAYRQRFAHTGSAQTPLACSRANHSGCHLIRPTHRAKEDSRPAPWLAVELPRAAGLTVERGPSMRLYQLAKHATQTVHAVPRKACSPPSQRKPLGRYTRVRLFLLKRACVCFAWFCCSPATR